MKIFPNDIQTYVLHNIAEMQCICIFLWINVSVVLTFAGLRYVDEVINSTTDLPQIKSHHNEN